MQLREIRGVGPKTEEHFSRLGIETAEDLLHHYPIGYDEYREPVPVASLRDGTKDAVAVILTGKPLLRRTPRGQIVTAEGEDPTGRIQFLWYNASFVASLLKRGSRMIFRGVPRSRGNRRVMDHPEIFTADKYEGVKNTLVPVYGLTKGLTGKTIARSVRAVLDTAPELCAEYLPDSVRVEMQLQSLPQSIHDIHFPGRTESLEAARRRLVFDEFFLFVLALRKLKEEEADAFNSFPMHAVWETEDLIERLPFRLTGAQLRVWHEIEKDLSGETLMSRLVQGDVGSGKTVIAFLAMLQSAVNDCQSAMMAPTEVLARQHYEKLCAMKETYGLDAVRPVLLTGSLRAAERREALAAIASGEANAVIGTHALIQDKVSYRRLALVITDEQHRFGVRQRKTMTEKGAPPHTLVMSATPIPRTLGVIYYGDLDISVIDELPARRLPIKNTVVDETWRDKATSFLKKQVDAGHQCYVICPMIEKSEELDVADVESETEMLRRALPSCRIDMLHGQMKPDIKNQIMEKFAAGETDILVSTTVVEVGVDVPNATVMMIENAERFGLAQLHQLRGRVGRGSAQSYCIFMAGQTSDQIMERLSILRDSDDGFVIAEKDFELRGPGDLLGIRQSGDALFSIADITRDGSVLKAAGECAGKLLREDPLLRSDENRSVHDALRGYLNRGGKTITL